MNSKPNSLPLRILSALILMPIVLVDLFLGGWLFIVMLGVAFILALREWLRISALSTQKMGHAFFGLVYIGLCFLSFAYIRLYYDGGEWLAIALLLTVWASDTGAYLFGKILKGPKMAPTISPNKTWAGLFGGAASSALAFYAFATYMGPFVADLLNTSFSFSGLETSIPILLFIGGLLTFSGQAGDLLISMQKRKVGVKDTGSLIPGHGGILDRIDSLMMSSLFFILVLLLSRS